MTDMADDIAYSLARVSKELRDALEQAEQCGLFDKSNDLVRLDTLGNLDRLDKLLRAIPSPDITWEEWHNTIYKPCKSY